MPRRKGDINTSTMIIALRDAGLYEPGMENDRPAVKAIYEKHVAAKDQKKAEFRAMVDSAEPLASSVLAVPAKKRASPTPTTEFGKRMDAAKDAARQRHARVTVADKNVPPFDASVLYEDTVVEGKTIEQWIAVLEAKEETAREARRDRSKLIILDFTALPGWALWAVEKWRARGCPTKKGAMRDEYATLKEKAEAQDKYAAMDENDAKELLMGVEGMRKQGAKPKLLKKEKAKAEKKLDAAKKKRAKAEAFRAEAEALLQKVKAA
jgi:hypothetical protein